MIREKYEELIPNNKMGSTYIPFPKEFIEKLKEKLKDKK